MNTLKIFFLLDAVAAALFSIINICFRLDIAVFAFPISAVFNAILFYVVYKRLLKNATRGDFVCVKKMLQYQPFVHFIAFVVRRAGDNGTAYAFDAACVLLWLFSFVFSRVILIYIDEKRIAKVNPAWKEFAARKKLKGVAWLGFETLDWIDALVQAVFAVLLFQIFFFQFYKIPSESMVPSLLVNDRLMVSKISSGPKFPLSDIGLPSSKEYKRGDIVVFRNPHYETGRKAEVQSVVSQLVYMLTVTFVNLNVDEKGNVKADPLVKRVAGVGGEQLMMVDGILYSRTKESPEFKPVQEDAKWASYNLTSLDANTKKMIHEFPISGEGYEQMTALEQKRNSLHIGAAEEECYLLAKKFAELSGYSPSAYVESDFISGNQLFIYNMLRDNFALTTKLLSSEQGAAYFTAFMTDWISSYNANLQNNLYRGNLYSDSMFRMNLMVKLNIGRFVVRNAELIKSGISSSDFMNDETLRECWKDAESLYNYAVFIDRRSMPVFPANDASGAPRYIPDGCYFMMGDNRFNSLDMRHSYEERLEPLCADDKYSVLYYTNMAPQYVPKTRILGTTLFRFWPKSRIGKI